MKPRLLFRLLVLALAAVASPAAAWWEYGHQTVAAIAMHEVRPATRAAVMRLLRQSRLLDTPTCPARTPEQASVWPDCIKDLRDRFGYTRPWHFQDIDICRPFGLRTPCRDGNCVSAQIERDVRLLKDRSVPLRERVAALAFLIHFVGDLHMPLHSADHDDAGGNRFRAFYGPIRSNLHTIWDGYLSERAISSPPAGAAGLLSELTPAQRTALAAGSMTDWSRESWEAARRFAYGSVVADPCGPPPAQPPVIDQAKVAALIPGVRLQVQRAGLRLARLLDEALG